MTTRAGGLPPASAHPGTAAGPVPSAPRPAARGRARRPGPGRSSSRRRRLTAAASRAWPGPVADRHGAELDRLARCRAPRRFQPEQRPGLRRAQHRHAKTGRGAAPGQHGDVPPGPAFGRPEHVGDPQRGHGDWILRRTRDRRAAQLAAVEQRHDGAERDQRAHGRREAPARRCASARRPAARRSSRGRRPPRRPRRPARRRVRARRPAGRPRPWPGRPPPAARRRTRSCPRCWPGRVPAPPRPASPAAPPRGRPRSRPASRRPS